MKKQILASILLALTLTMFTGCGNSNDTTTMPEGNNGTTTDGTANNSGAANNSVNDLPNAPDNGSNVQCDNNTVGDNQKPNDGSVTQDAKNMMDDAGNMVGDAAKNVGDAMNDAGNAVKNAADDMQNKK